MVALLRGVNVGGNRRVPMADLAALAERAGFSEVDTYIQSGNLIFSSRLGVERAAAVLETAIEKAFGFDVPVVVRAASQWSRYSAGSPFPGAEKERANLLHLGLAKAAVEADAAKMLRERATLGERIEVRGDALWIDYVGGAGRSKLTPAVLDRAAGSPVTCRNWKTVCALAELLAGDAD